MAESDDSFELFDLRVEAVIPEGKPIYCGAKSGDYFELKGEMLSMPAGQGFSIYSISAVLPLLAAKQRPTHQERLDDVGCRDRLSRSQLRQPAEDHQDWEAPVQPCRDHGGAAAEGE